MALTLDTTHKSASGQYHLCLRFAMNGKRYYYRLGEKYTSADFDVICKADGRGRGGNDISMIKAAGIGIAMGNALESLKREADYTTTSVDDDGVLNALRHFSLI